jgi:hypothetical protein
MRRALVSVDRGHVKRVYRGKGDVFKASPGIGAATLWKLARNGLTADGRTITRGMDKGESALEAIAATAWPR